MLLHEYIHRAADRIEREGWTQGEFDTRYAYCLLGSLYITHYGSLVNDIMRGKDSLRIAAVNEIHKTLMSYWGYRHFHLMEENQEIDCLPTRKKVNVMRRAGSIAAWNDAWMRRRKTVIKVMRKTADRIEFEENQRKLLDQQQLNSLESDLKAKWDRLTSDQKDDFVTT